MVAPNRKTKKRTKRISNGSFSDAQQNTEASNLIQPMQDVNATRDDVNWGGVAAKDPRIDDQYKGSRTTAADQGPDSNPVRSKSWESAPPSPEPPNPSVNDPYRGARGVNNDVPDMGDVFGKSQPSQPGTNNPAQPVIPAAQAPDPNEQPRIKPGDESFGDFSFDEGEGAAIGSQQVETTQQAPGQGAPRIAMTGKVNPYWENIQWGDVRKWAEGQGFEGTDEELEAILAGAGIPYYSDNIREVSEAEKLASKSKLFGSVEAYGKFDPKENMKNWNASGVGQVINKTTENAMKGIGAAGVTSPGGQTAGAGVQRQGDNDGKQGGADLGSGAGQTGGEAPGTGAAGAGQTGGKQQGGELTWEQLAKDLGVSIGGTIASRTPYLANAETYTQLAGSQAAEGDGSPAGTGQTGGEAPGTGAKDGAGTTGGEAPGTEVDGGDTGIDAWTNQANQTWQGFLDWEKKRQEQMRKEQNRMAWYNLMSKGLIGAANLAGTINGAPSLQLDMSVDEKNDPYARMKEDRTYMANLVNKRIEQINKEREAYRKAKNDLSNITLKRQAEERLYTDTMSRIKEREAKAVLDQDKANLAAEARKEQQRHNMAMEEFKQEEIKLKREMSQYDKTLKQSQASRNNRSGGSGRSGSGDKTARRQVLDDNFVADVKAKIGSRYRELSGYRRGDKSNETQKAINALKAWIKSNPNDAEAKKLLEDYNRKKSNL